MIQSLLPSILVLGPAALASLALAKNRPSAPEHATRRKASQALAIATAIQLVHFSEEALTGFPERLGALLGLPAMPMYFFFAFNLALLGAWLLSIPGLRSARFAAFFAAWFLAIAGMINAVAHPLLAIAAGGYFPGLGTAPFIGAAGAWLWLRLRDATEPTHR